MALFQSPQMIQDSLILSMDAANIKSNPIQKNVLRYSSNLAFVWALNSRVVRTLNAGVAPDGTNTAVRLDIDGPGSGIYQYTTLTGGKTYTYSVYLKYISGDPVVRFGNDNAPISIINFNTLTGTWTTASGSPFNVVVSNVGDNWYRVSFSLIPTSTISAPMIVYGDSIKSIFMWGPQIEQSTSVGTYVPTTVFTSFFDMSSNQMDGTLTNGASYGADNNGIVNLNGVDGLIVHSSNLTAINNITGSTNFTMSMFMKINSMPAVSSGNASGLLQKGSYNQSFGMNILWSGDTGGFRNTANLYCGLRNTALPVTQGYGEITTTSPVSLAAGQWYRLDFVHSFSGTTHTVTTYINGYFDSTVSLTDFRYPINITNASSLTVLGNVLGGNSMYFNMSVSNYQIYNRALSATEILQNFNALRGRYGI